VIAQKQLESLVKRRKITYFAVMAAVAESAKAITPPTKFLSSEEFLDWLEPGIHADLIAGEIVMHSPVSFKHSKLLNFVDPLLRLYIAEKRLGELFREVNAVKLGPRNIFLPDLCFFTNEQVSKLQPAYAPFAPTLAVEVLSPSSELRDRRQKFAAYETYGVREYWILDPERGLHQFYRHNGEAFEPFGSITEDRMDSEVIPGFYLRRLWLPGPEFPGVRECLQEILQDQ
jgi:Uma2 family endonuclease